MIVDIRVPDGIEKTKLNKNKTKKHTNRMTGTRAAVVRSHDWYMTDPRVRSMHALLS
jgi:hypothetical protein